MKQADRKREELRSLYDSYNNLGKKVGNAASHTGSVLAKTPEFTSLTSELRVLEEKIDQLEEELTSVIIIDPSKIPSNIVSVVSMVRVKDSRYDMEERYCFDGVASDENWIKISSKSPIGRSLLGKKCGDIVEIKTPGGLKRIEILEVVRGKEYKI